MEDDLFPAPSSTNGVEPTLTSRKSTESINSTGSGSDGMLFTGAAAALPPAVIPMPVAGAAGAATPFWANEEEDDSRGRRSATAPVPTPESRGQAGAASGGGVGGRTGHEDLRILDPRPPSPPQHYSERPPAAVDLAVRVRPDIFARDHGLAANDLAFISSI